MIPAKGGEGNTRGFATKTNSRDETGFSDPVIPVVLHRAVLGDANERVLRVAPSHPVGALVVVIIVRTRRTMIAPSASLHG